MNKPIRLDVLIVYNQALASSASDTSVENKTPFLPASPNQIYNTVYGYFLEICHKSNLTAGLTTSADIIGAGYCRSFWQFKRKQWHRINSPCFSTLIFDKFSPTGKKGKSCRRLLFSSANIKPFNDPDLFKLFFDKQKTYDKLSQYAIPTISLDKNNLKNVKNACKTLSRLTHRHPTPKDFSSDIIMKDRFGAGGRRVYKFKTSQSEQMLSVIRRNTNVSYIIQPFIKFDQGFNYHHRPALADIRLIYLKGKIVQSYIRVAKSGEFRCNEHQGGLLTYLSLNEIPPTLVNKANLIAKILNKKHSLFTLDFIISNFGNSYLLEGNTGPGLDWNVSLKKNKIEAKKLIRLIIKELSVRVKTQAGNQPTLLTYDPVITVPSFTANIQTNQKTLLSGFYSTKVKAYPLLFTRPVLPIR